VAVAIKKLGYTHIKIYNGGIKDWVDAGHKIESTKPLPKYEGMFITEDELLRAIASADKNDCKDLQNQPLLTILDLRTDNYLEADQPVPDIRTRCKTIKCLLDDLINPDFRKQLPREGLVVTLTETGNRDIFAMRYLYQYGYKNIKGLDFGIRGWIKLNYPVETKDPSK
jgi:rhodanese-related sulfurtransferase